MKIDYRHKVKTLEDLAAAMEAALDGRLPRPPDESWKPYELDAVVDEFLLLMFDRRANGSPMPVR